MDPFVVDGAGQAEVPADYEWTEADHCHAAFLALKDIHDRRFNSERFGDDE